MKTPYVFNAPEANLGLKIVAEDRVKNQKLALGWNGALFPTLSNMNPLYPGTLWVVHGCTGEGKSAIARWFVNNVSKLILADGLQAEQKVLLCGLEESMEVARARTMKHWVDFRKVMDGTIDMGYLDYALAQSSDDPIYYVGDSMAGAAIHPDAAEFRGLTPKDLALIAFKINSEKKLMACVVDYIQLMMDNACTPDMPTRVVNLSKELYRVVKATCKCPTLAIAQSKVDVKGRADKRPGKYDIQWTSSFAQDADVIWSTWKPSADYHFGETFELQGVTIPALKDILVVTINKWKDSPDNVENVSFIIGLCQGGKFGNLYEVSLDELGELDIDQLVRTGVKNLWQTQKIWV